MTSVEFSIDAARRSPDLELYEELRFGAKRLALEILDVENTNDEDPQVRYFLDQAASLARIDASTRGIETGVAGDVIESLRTHLPGFLTSSFSAAELRERISKELGHSYWHRFNVMKPMGDYAKSCADFLLANRLVSKKTLELGAGVGNTSRLVQSAATGHYVRTDKQAAFLGLPFGHERDEYDFDFPGRWRDQDTVFAVNAVHCAKDKETTLRFVFEMLAPGGWLVLGEGQNRVRDREPWCLNLVCGLYDGWWDRGGFLDRDQWFDVMGRVGFERPGALPLRAGPFDFGGLLWCRRPF